MRNKQLVLLYLLMIFFFITIFSLILSNSMQKSLDHDEHQFIASAKLLETKLLLPYKDYPYFHMPNLVLIYAIIFKFSNYLLLSSRFCSVIFSFLCLIAIFLNIFKLFSEQNLIIRVFISFCSVLFFIFNPLFIFTSGFAWNHDSSLFFFLLAFFVHCFGLRQDKSEKWLIFSGVLLGLAIGIRLSFAPCLAPFVAAIWIGSNKAKMKNLYLMVWFFCGFFISMLPSIFLFSLAPKDFVFGNIGYAKLNTLYRYDMGYERAMTLIGKIKYLLKDVLSEPGNLAVIITFFYLTVQWVSIALKKPRSLHFEVVYIFILLPFIFFGSFAPTPSWYQYFYAPMAFLIIGIFYIIYDLQNFDKIRKSNLWLIAIVLVFLFIYAIPKYKGIGNVINLEKWFPVKAHQQGVNISDVVSEGEVLTLAPIFPLEGGLCIYNEFVMSPFAWRVAHILPVNKRNELGLIGVGDLETFLSDKCPDAILVGFESPIMEEPLNTFAEKEGYDLIKLDGKILWVIEN